MLNIERLQQGPDKYTVYILKLRMLRLQAVIKFRYDEPYKEAI